MALLNSYIFFNGNCRDAIRFYEKTLGGKLDAVVTYGDSPDPEQCPAAMKDLVMHAHLTVGDSVLMASDSPPEHYKPAGAFSLALNYPTAAEARRIFDALADGGQVALPLGETFWAETFGMLTDKFGTPWMVGGGQKKA